LFSIAMMVVGASAVSISNRMELASHFPQDSLNTTGKKY